MQINESCKELVNLTCVCGEKLDGTPQLQMQYGKYE